MSDDDFVVEGAQDWLANSKTDFLPISHTHAWPVGDQKNHASIKFRTLIEADEDTFNCNIHINTSYLIIFTHI